MDFNVTEDKKFIFSLGPLALTCKEPARDEFWCSIKEEIHNYLK